MKKIITVILTLICLLTTAVALTSCSGTYYQFEFQLVDGVEIESEVMSGAKVLDGYTVTFSLNLDEKATGTPIVKANGATINPDGNGKYSVTVNKDTVVSVSNVFVQTSKTVTFDKGADRITYASENGDAETGFEVEPGTEVKFTVEASVFYVQSGYEVLANTEIVTPDANGVYTITVDDDVVISVSGLVQEDNFTMRADGGRGTANNPYKISRPIDLFYMSALINDEFWIGTGYYHAYYELVNDIDMKGEEIFVIGDQTSSTAFFGGNFNGNGYTISNFVINGYKYDANGAKVFLPYVGMFGTVAATTASAPTVYGLNLDNFTVYVDAANAGSMSTVGAIAGMTVGGNITGCSVTNGKVEVSADLGNFTYVGGIVGVHQSAYESDRVRFYGTITSCYSDVDAGVRSGYAYAAGGIAGYVMSYEDKTNAYVINCHSAGATYGAFNTGGIVGAADPFTSISGCYSTGTVEAVSTINLTGDSSVDEFAYANAGGIAGMLGTDSVISDSFSTATLVAYAVAGNSYTKTDDIVANLITVEKSEATSYPAVILNCYGKNANAKSVDWVKNTLKWSDADWNIEEGKYPTLNLDETTKEFDIVINYGITINGQTQKVVEADNLYVPMSYWYSLLEENDEFVLPEFVQEGNLRSYGYFFDEELTERVPYGFVPTRDFELYLGVADITEVSGIYYINNNANLYLDFKTDGTVNFVDGARVLSSTYSYDGENLRIYDTSIARLGTYEDEETQQNALNYYYSFIAEKEGVTLKIWDGTFYTETTPFTAISRTFDNANILEGTWTANANESFEVTVSRNFTWDIDGVTATGEKRVNFNEVTGEIEFTDGANTVFVAILTNEGYVKITEVIYDLNIEVGDTLTFSEDYVGEWTFFNSNDRVVINLNGKKQNGVGVGTIEYETVGAFDILYEHKIVEGKRYLFVYDGDLALAALEYDATEKTLEGELLWYRSGLYRDDAKFCLTDEYIGEWSTENDGIKTLNFNGLGYYQLKGTTAHFAVRGKVYINNQTEVRYTVTSNAGRTQASFVYEEVEYTATISNDKLTVTSQEGEFTAVRFDEWKNLTLVDDEGSVFSFDGKGNLTSGGKMFANGSIVATYVINADGSIAVTPTGESSASVTIEKDEDSGLYAMSNGSSVSLLSIKNDFTGEYVIYGLGSMTIGKFGYDRQATGEITVGEQSVSALFTLSADGASVTVDAEGITLKGRVYGNKLILTFDEQSYGSITAMSEDKADEYYGAYTNAQGWELQMDGFGETDDGGYAKLTKDSVTKEYSYFVSNGEITLVDDEGKEYALQERADEGNESYAIEGKYYDLVEKIEE